MATTEIYVHALEEIGGDMAEVMAKILAALREQPT
jgi:hypothetical protein